MSLPCLKLYKIVRHNFYKHIKRNKVKSPFLYVVIKYTQFWHPIQIKDIEIVTYAV